LLILNASARHVVVLLGRDVSRKSARIGARTIGGMAGGTLLVTTLVIVSI